MSTVPKKPVFSGLENSFIADWLPPMPTPMMSAGFTPCPSAARTAPSTASSFRPNAIQCLNFGFLVSVMLAALKAASVSVFACGLVSTFAAGKPALVRAATAPSVRSLAVGSWSYAMRMAPTSARFQPRFFISCAMASPTCSPIFVAEMPMCGTESIGLPPPSTRRSSTVISLRLFWRALATTAGPSFTSGTQITKPCACCAPRLSMAVSTSPPLGTPIFTSLKPFSLAA